MEMVTARVFVRVFVFAFVFCTTLASAADKYTVLVGTYTGKQSKGIYSFQFDPSTGKVTTPELAGETENPSWIALDPQGKYLYAVNEVGNFQGKKEGAVSVFEVERGSGAPKLKFLQQVTSLGADPAYLTIDHSGRNLLVANYTGGNIVVYPIQKDGRLGEKTAFDQHTGSSVNKERQEGPHAHSIQMSNDNRYALSADLGMDKVLIYQFDAAKGTLTPSESNFAKITPGSGPRHVAFAPNGKYVYVTNEMASTIASFTYDAKTGEMKQFQTVSTLPEGDDAPGNSTAEIAIDPKGRTLYVSNRGDDSKERFTINPSNGRLMFEDTVKTGGKTPRYFTLDPTGKWLLAANQDSNDIFLFKVDPKSGKLTATGTRIEIGSPVSLVFLKAK